VIDKKLLLIILMNGALASMIVALNFLLFREIENLFLLLNTMAGLIFTLPIVMIKYSEYRKYKEIEEKFPIFLRDFVEAVRGGIPVPQALKSLTKNNYKSLSFYVKKMAAQMDWGISVEKVLLNFSKEVKSKLIGRIVSSVIESHRFGGNLADTFEALANTSFEVEKLRAERRLYLNSQIITGYIVFFIFLAVIIGLGRFLVPTLGGSTAISLTEKQVASCDSFTAQATCEAQIGADGKPRCYWVKESKKCQAVVVREYKNLFMTLIFIQGLFAGLSVGKMAEGAIIAGIKHSLIMTLVGVLIYAILG
jgi:flagellar protein FlaJ